MGGRENERDPNNINTNYFSAILGMCGKVQISGSLLWQQSAGSISAENPYQAHDGKEHIIGPRQTLIFHLCGAYK